MKKGRTYWTLHAKNYDRSMVLGRPIPRMVTIEPAAEAVRGASRVLKVADQIPTPDFRSRSHGDPYICCMLRSTFRACALVGSSLAALALGSAPRRAELPRWSPPPSVAGKPFHYPLDEELRLSHVQVRGTHNSYHIDTHSGSIEPWQYTHAPIYEQLDRLAVCQAELDVFYDEVEGLTVVHVPFVDAGTRCQRLSDCLAELRRFSDSFPGPPSPLCPDRAQKADIPSEDRDILCALGRRDSVRLPTTARNHS